ncbi:hypothetical protein D9M73_170590 [compost metagenome]
MPPFGNAVRLVHHQQGNRHLGDEVAETLVLQALHRDHQHLQLAGPGALHHLGGLLATLRRVDAGGGNAVAGKESQLVLHQRQQRRNHQGQVRQVQRWQLVAQRLAGAGGKDRRGRMPGQYGTDRRLLAGAELAVAEDAFEGVMHGSHSVDHCMARSSYGRPAHGSGYRLASVGTVAGCTRPTERMLL